MGGQGSGRTPQSWRYERKFTVEECFCLDANAWMSEGALKAGVRRTGSWRWACPGVGEVAGNCVVDTRDPARPFVRLLYAWAWDPARQPGVASYRVRLTVTYPHFGGLRWWFVCPLTVGGRPCGRRVARLHLPPGGGCFGCRRCHGLTYLSCQESRKRKGSGRVMGLGLGALR
jgi:hypothetical protein